MFGHIPIKIHGYGPDIGYTKVIQLVCCLPVSSYKKVSKNIINIKLVQISQWVKGSNITTYLKGQ